MRLPFTGNYPITQPFGANPQDYAQFGMKGHNGIDYGLPCGTPVVAAISGYATCLEDPAGFGHYIVISNSQFAQVITAHLSQFLIKNGNVSEGQVIGLSGTTGNSSGCHLHFGVKPVGYNSSNGFLGAVDPTPYLNHQEVSVNPDNAIVDKPFVEVLVSMNYGYNPYDPGTLDPGKQQWVTDRRTVRYVIDEIGKDPARFQYLVNTGQLVKPGTPITTLAPGNYKVK